jgi:Cu/Ag efflux pump CusA
VGGILTSFVMELMVYPPIYEIWKWNFEMKKGRITAGKRYKTGDL